MEQATTTRAFMNSRGTRRWGVIADDYTGATDVAAVSWRAGLETTIAFGAPTSELAVDVSDATVIALKIRTAEVSAARSAAANAVAWLMRRSVDRFYVKYCSTFDSTPTGNIGPIVDEVMMSTGALGALICPAAPAHGRTVYKGHLFVGDSLLAETAMRHHPLTPMLDSNIVRVLRPQTSHEVQLMPREFMALGAASIRRRLEELGGSEARHVVADSLLSSDLATVAAAIPDSCLATGSAGLAAALAARMAPVRRARRSPRPLPPGRTIVVAGSCSAATLRQLGAMATACESLYLSPVLADTPEGLTAAAKHWLHKRAQGTEPLLIYSSAPLDERLATGHVFGAATADVLEQALSSAARYAVDELGFHRVVVAGGETSGAVVDGLGITSASVIREEDLGVPWIAPTHRPDLALLLKSGNFGRASLLVDAVAAI
ncbi:MAG: 3-oxo-tetronate kinase [Leifsonia sp.]